MSERRVIVDDGSMGLSGQSSVSAQSVFESLGCVVTCGVLVLRSTAYGTVIAIALGNRVGCSWRDAGRACGERILESAETRNYFLPLM